MHHRQSLMVAPKPSLQGLRSLDPEPLKPGSWVAEGTCPGLNGRHLSNPADVHLGSKTLIIRCWHHPPNSVLPHSSLFPGHSCKFQTITVISFFSHRHRVLKSPRLCWTSLRVFVSRKFTFYQTSHSIWVCFHLDFS